MWRGRIDNSTIENSASYINSWLRSLKDGSRLVVQAAAQAQKASDYILGKEERARNKENTSMQGHKHKAGRLSFRKGGLK